MKKTCVFFIPFVLTAVSAFAQASSAGNPPGSINVIPSGAHQPGDYWGAGGGVDFPIQNVDPNHHGVLSLVSGRSLGPNLVGEGELDGMAYSAGANGGLLDMRLFGTLKLMPDLPYFQPYGLAGFGFAGLLGIDANTPNLMSLDFIWGCGFRIEVIRRTFLFLDWKMHILVRDYPTGIDSPLTGGILFPF